MFKRLKKIKYNSGMTLVELIVVLAIFMIILGLTIVDYSSFKSTTTIQNLADDIALSVRKAQSYAIGSKSFLDASNYSASGYGIHFTSNSETNKLFGSNKSFIIFSDNNKDNDYDFGKNGNFVCGTTISTQNDECIEIIDIKSSAKIISIKVGNQTISPDESLDILFKRPNPDAKFCYKKDPNKTCKSNYSDVTITVASSKLDAEGNYFDPKDIIIRNTGQISVQ